MAATDRWADEDFLPLTEAAQRTTPPRLAILFLSLVLFCCLTALVWAALAELDEVTVGEGKVVPARKMQVIQNLEGGIVKDMMVSEGDVVDPEQVLLRIDDTAFAASYAESRVKSLNLMASVQRLTAEVEDKPLEFSEEVMAERPDFAATEKANYLARQSSQKAEIATLQQQLSQRESELVELRNRLQKLDRSHALLVEELRTTSPLVASGAIARVEVLRLERQVNEIKGDLDGTRLAIPRAEAAISEIRRKIEERISATKTEAFRELTAKRAELAAVSESIMAHKDRVERTEVRSPVRGIVQAVKIKTLGGVIRPGMDLMEIVPLDDSLLVEARIRSSDVGFIHAGLPATVKLSAYDFSIFGGLPAKVEKVSADSVTDEKTGQSFYIIQVRTEATHLKHNDEVLPVLPGMVATVDVLTGKKTVLDYLLKPFFKTKEKALRER